MLAGDLLPSLHEAGFVAARRGHPELAEALRGWTLAGCQAVEAGPSAGAYVANLTEGFDDEEVAELLGLGHESGPRWFIRSDVVSARLTAGLVAWREVSYARPVLYPDRQLRRELRPDFAELDDGECVARAQELELFDRAKLAASTKGAGASGEQSTPAPPTDGVPSDEEGRRPPPPFPSDPGRSRRLS